MDPVQTAMTLFEVAKHAVSLTKYLQDADLKLNEAESKLKIAELYVCLSKIVGDEAQLKGQLLDKDAKIEELEAKIHLKEEVEWRDPFYFMKSTGAGPFCQCCYDKDNRLVRLPKPDSAWYLCKVCGSTYENAGHPKTRRVFNSGSESWMGS